MGNADGVLFCDACGGTLAVGGGSLLGGRLLCADCLRQLEGRRVRWRPSPRVLGLAVTVLAVSGLAAYLWHRHDVARRQEEAKDAAFWAGYLRTCEAVRPILRLRGEISPAGEAKAVRDVRTIQVFAGLSEEDAIGILKGAVEGWAAMPATERSRYRLGRDELYRRYWGDQRREAFIAAGPSHGYDGASALEGNLAEAASRPDLCYAIELGASYGGYAYWVDHHARPGHSGFNDYGRWLDEHPEGLFPSSAPKDP